MTDITDNSIFSLLNYHRRSILNIELKKIDIPTGENPKIDIIYHPLKFINKQWVFITASTDYRRLHEFISKSLLY
jgi:hypothetical protein